VEPVIIQQTGWHDYVTVLATVIIALATAANVWVSYRLWRATSDSANITRRIFEAANSPYLSVKLTPNRDETRRTIATELLVKNVGTVPATKFSVERIPRFNGSPMPVSKVPSEPTTLNPSDDAIMLGSIGEPHYAQLMNGTGTLDITVDLTYQGPSEKQYKVRDEYRYEPKKNVFIRLGTYME